MTQLEKKEIRKIAKALDLSSKRTKIAVIKIFNEKITTKTETCFLPRQEIAKLNNKKSLVTATYLDFTGFFGGRTVLLLPEPVRKKITAQFLKDFPIHSKKLEKSAVLEYANIVVGAFLSELSNYCQVNLLETVPKFKQGNNDKLFKIICSGKKDDLALLFQTRFIFKKEQEFSFYILMDGSCSQKLASSLKYA